MDDLDVECAIRVSWEGLEVEATCPPHLFASVLGAVGNEMLRLNAALSSEEPPILQQPS